MKLTFEGHDERYLIETLSLLFFPAAGFSDEVEDGLSSFTRVAGGMTYAAVTAGGVTEREEEPAGEDVKRALARAYYRAGGRLTGITPPWGTLTGIRPAKRVAAMLAGGMTADEAAAELWRTCYTSPDKTRLCAAVAAAEDEALKKLDRRAVSLYVGIPFCPTRCAYCSFVSHSVEKEGRFIPAYVDALIEEIDGTLSRLTAPVQSVYFGGGTPTTLSAEQLTRVMAAVARHVDVANLLEYTVEAGRPDTITPEKLAAIRAGGADRISVNPQTTCDATLAAIGRAHSAEDFFKAYELAKDFPVVNVDLIAGLPGETPEIFEKSLADVIALAPANLTVHSLSLKRAARMQYADMARSRQHSGDIFRMLQTASEKTAAAHLRPYYLYRQRNTLGNLENVGYALPRTEGLYNIYIMGEYQSIVAMGCGGVSKVTDLAGRRIERLFNDKHVHEYLRGAEKRELHRRRLLALLDSRII
ncbi:MAG TPA: coproporphyrinogen dehydrogenase HemZ [Terriglobales bacterium]|nr:coproporphyrinogen dehydrogenase HemZ [Terriglobales bacterium]